MPGINLKDENSITRKPNRIFMKDSNNTTRKLKSLWIKDVNGINRKIYSTGPFVSSSPYIDSWSFGYGGNVWSFDSGYSNFYMSGNAVHVSLRLTFPSGNPSQIGPCQFGVVLPIDLGTSLSFAGNQPYLRISGTITGTGSYTDPVNPNTNATVTFPNYMAAEINTSGGMHYAHTGTYIPFPRGGSSSIVYNQTAGTTCAPYSSLYTETFFLWIYFYIDSVIPDHDHGNFINVSTTFSTNAFTFISGSEEYPLTIGF